MKYALVIAAFLLVLVPTVSFAGHLTLFPDNNGMLSFTSAEVNGIDHFLMQANLADLNLHAVFLDSLGNPAFQRFPLPWVFGILVGLEQVGESFVFTWNAFGSTGGTNPRWVPIGTITVTVTP